MGREVMEGIVCVSGTHSQNGQPCKTEGSTTTPKIRYTKQSFSRQASYPHSIFCQVTEKISTIPLTKLSPFERLLVTAKGDLQRIISSWCYETVSVEVFYYSLDEDASTETEKRYKRKVGLKCRNRQFCTANSEVVLSNKLLIDSLATNEVGIGQLFRQFNLLPNFELISFERSDSQSDTSDFSRKYSLTAPGIKCIIEEMFDVVEIRRLEQIVIGEVIQQQDLSKNKINTKSNNRLLSVPLDCNSAEFTPFERVLLSAYDNVPRLVSSYLNSPVELVITRSCKLGESSYLRVVELKCVSNNKLFCVATCEFTILDLKLQQQLDNGEFELNDIFRKYRGGSLPMFKLVSASKIKNRIVENDQNQDRDSLLENLKLNALHRSYILSTPFARVHVHELFEPWTTKMVQTEE
mmetsp:Transcript_15030/g.17036  ORF Transcript_15030/g.17036 Transcript_15030/m.17036 type:complete len:409 (-) Transcript_15030:1084-2310(-)